MNTEPYWTRDGGDCVSWSRMVHADRGPYGTYAMRSAADAKPGDEQCLSATNEEWVGSSLRDGRLFVKKNGARSPANAERPVSNRDPGSAYYLMTPHPGGKSTYVAISYPGSYHYLHKVTISNDETRIAYMKHINTEVDEYRGAEIVIADFDASIPAITNEVAFSPLDETRFSWYVSISPDNRHLIFAEDGKMMEFSIDTGVSTQVSTRDDVQYRYPVYVGSIK